MSYVRAGQQADKYLISKELERKAIHNLTKEVIYAYWKTLSADELLAEINPLMDRVNKALDDYEYIEQLLISSPMDALLSKRITRRFTNFKHTAKGFHGLVLSYLH